MQENSPMTNARQLYETLRKDIANGTYPTDSKLPSIRTLADKYDLCTNTVNTAIAMLVNEGIVTVRKGSGSYVTRAPKKSRMIGVLMFDFISSTRVDSAILEAIQKNLPDDYYFSLVNTYNNYDAFCDSLEHLLDAGAAGLLLVPPTQLPADLTRIQSLLGQIPTVFINRGIPGVDADIYSMDLYRGTLEALEYLYATGKRKTLIIPHNSEKFATEQLLACENHKKNYHLPPESIVAMPMEGTLEELHDRVAALSGQFDSFITSDNILVQMTDIFTRQGIAIPSELSLVGINDTLLSRIHNPPLTSIAYPARQVGKNAVSRLIERVEVCCESAGKLHNYKPEFIIRKT